MTSKCTWWWYCPSMRCAPMNRVGKSECNPPPPHPSPPPPLPPPPPPPPKKKKKKKNSGTQFCHWLHVTWKCFKMWYKHSGSDYTSMWPWCKPLVHLTRHVVVQNATGPVQFLSLDNVTTGTGQCSCIHQIDQQKLPVSNLLETFQWPIN